MKFDRSIAFILLVLLACNKPIIHNYDFRVKNNTNEKITVRYLKAFQTGAEMTRDILPGDESILFAESTETNQKKVYDLYTDSITYFRSISVIKTNTGDKTRNNMKARNEWNYIKIDDSNVNYVLQIDTFDF